MLCLPLYDLTPGLKKLVILFMGLITAELLGFRIRLSACLPATAADDPLPAWALTDWTDSHATFYGGPNAEGTMGGACGYGNTFNLGYGISTAALSETLFNKGLTCGACFELKCKQDSERGSKWCYKDTDSIVITATNSCPPNWNRPTNNGGWCNPPRTHFDLSFPMFMRLAVPVAGIVEVSYRRIRCNGRECVIPEGKLPPYRNRTGLSSGIGSLGNMGCRVPCSREGGIHFTIMGNRWFNLVLVHNVGDAGAVKSLEIKGSQTEWLPMTQNWGQLWEVRRELFNQSLSFRVTISNGKSMEACEVVPQNWQFGQTFDTNNNF